MWPWLEARDFFSDKYLSIELENKQQQQQQRTVNHLKLK